MPHAGHVIVASDGRPLWLTVPEHERHVRAEIDSSVTLQLVSNQSVSGAPGLKQGTKSGRGFVLMDVLLSYSHWFRLADAFPRSQRYLMKRDLDGSGLAH